MTRAFRAFINQPSTHSPLHDWDGRNVIAVASKCGTFYTVYPTFGEVISLIVPTLALSLGWTGEGNDGTH